MDNVTNDLHDCLAVGSPFSPRLEAGEELTERVYMTQSSTSISTLNKSLLQLALGILRPFWTLSSNRSHNMESIIKKNKIVFVYKI